MLSLEPVANTGQQLSQSVGGPSFRYIINNCSLFMSVFQLSVLRGDKAKATALGMWMGAASLITDPLQKVERTFVLVM